MAAAISSTRLRPSSITAWYHFRFLFATSGHADKIAEFSGVDGMSSDNVYEVVEGLIESDKRQLQIPEAALAISSIRSTHIARVRRSICIM
jgi:hypothetical protein